mmetsp:Transcript_21737/g.41172  ORF Transcript_21737/g.41172 Transcript_21737/m.41172 type:complete len:159 (-) Transcript_21737:28-504(-)|eukprot:scaffold9732_cov180-Amphora_coffeaeformis.AAC.2
MFRISAAILVKRGFPTAVAVHRRPKAVAVARCMSDETTTTTTTTTMDETSALIAVKEAIENASRMRALEFAISQVDNFPVRFSKNHKEEQYDEMVVTELRKHIKAALIQFRRKEGYIFKVEKSSHRVAMLITVQDLTGMKARSERTDDGKSLVFLEEI